MEIKNKNVKIILPDDLCEDNIIALDPAKGYVEVKDKKEKTIIYAEWDVEFTGDREVNIEIKEPKGKEKE